MDLKVTELPIVHGVATTLRSSGLALRTGCTWGASWQWAFAFGVGGGQRGGTAAGGSKNGGAYKPPHINNKVPASDQPHHQRAYYSSHSSPSSSFTQQVQLNLILEQKRSMEELLEVVESSGDDFNAVNCATALNRLSRIAHSERNSTSWLTADSRFIKLMDQVQAKLGSAKPAQQNQLVSSLARLGLSPDARLSKLLVERVAMDAKKYRPIELAGLTNGFARIEASHGGPCWPRDLLDALASRTVEVMGESPGDVLANIFCSLGKMGYRPSHAMVLALTTRLTPDLASLDSHWMAQTVACLARGEVHPQVDFLEAVRDETLRRLNHMPPLDLAMIVSAFGRLTYRPGRFFFLSVINHFSKRADSFKDPQAISLLANGMSNLGVRAPDHFAPSLVRIAWDRLRDFKPAETANLLGALGKLRAEPDERFLSGFTDLVLFRMDKYNPSELSNVVFGMVRMRYHLGQEFVEALTRRCLACCVSGGGPRDMAAFLQSYVRLGQRPSDDVLRRMISCFQRGLAEETWAPENSLAIFTSALATLEVSPGGAFMRLAAEAALGPAHEPRGGGAAGAGGTGRSTTSALHLSMFLSALSRLGYEPSPAQLERALARMTPTLHTLTARALFNLLWSLARWDVRCQSTSGLAFLAAIAREAPKRLGDYQTAELVLVALSLAQIGFREATQGGLLVGGITDLVQARPEVYTDSEAASLVSSLTAMGVISLPPILLTKAGRQKPEGGAIWLEPVAPPPSAAAAGASTPTVI